MFPQVLNYRLWVPHPISPIIQNPNTIPPKDPNTTPHPESSKTSCPRDVKPQALSGSSRQPQLPVCFLLASLTELLSHSSLIRAQLTYGQRASESQLALQFRLPTSCGIARPAQGPFHSSSPQRRPHTVLSSSLNTLHSLPPPLLPFSPPPPPLPPLLSPSLHPGLLPPHVF